ncbi:hypothetical protein C0033_08600 [Clostridium sp. chh4-2]|uniref:glycosyltransferase family 32 protein n=1 Tax=Clostridium sp. chh4-2 TaxID=2067550 RepID=UPI000CCE7853|nr:glycosyltransferase [Clostridium sp. chh4-2]PNV62607.1 hypothetical protein C0033_08600 [Clostridium sp. chh4-2]
MVNLKNCAIKEFFHRASGLKVYTFGAGGYIQKFCERNKDWRIEEVITQFVDNNKEKQKKKYLLNRKEFFVLSVEDMLGIIEKDDIILISSLYYGEIIEQLDQMDNLNGIDCYILPYLEANKLNLPEKSIDIFPLKEGVQKIPKIIHYCWFGEGRMSAKELFCIESWKKYCPDYEIICWNEKNYDIRKNKYMLQAYQKKFWGFVPDYARLDIVNTYGGLYLDTDVEILKPLDDLLQFNGFVGFQNFVQVNLGQGFGAVKENKAIRKMLEKYNDLEFCDANGEVNLTPSPYYQTESLQEIGLKTDGTFQELKDISVLPCEYLNGINWYTLTREVTLNTYSIHHYAGSWLNDKEKENSDWRKTYGEWIEKRMQEEH